MACGRSVAGDPAYLPQAEYGGRAVYFCTEFCLRAFQSDPERFYSAHSRQEPVPGVAGSDDPRQRV
jgi:YHS domain-containing protein